MAAASSSSPQKPAVAQESQPRVDVPSNHAMSSSTSAPKNQNLSIQFQSDGAITLSGQIEDLFGDFGSMFGGDFDIEAPSDVGAWDYPQLDQPSASTSSSTSISSHPSVHTHPSSRTPTNMGTPGNDPQHSISLALLEAAESCEPITSPSASTQGRFAAVIPSYSSSPGEVTHQYFFPSSFQPSFLWGDPTLSQNAIVRFLFVCFLPSLRCLIPFSFFPQQRPPPGFSNLGRPLHTIDPPVAQSPPTSLPSLPYSFFQKPSYSSPIPQKVISPQEAEQFLQQQQQQQRPRQPKQQPSLPQTKLQPQSAQTKPDPSVSLSMSQKAEPGGTPPHSLSLFQWHFSKRAHYVRLGTPNCRRDNNRNLHGLWGTKNSLVAPIERREDALQCLRTVPEEPQQQQITVQASPSSKGRETCRRL